jgi:hypothetical protein
MRKLQPCLNPIEFIAASSGLIIALPSRCFRTRRKAFIVNNRPRDAMFLCLRFAGIVSPNPFVEIFA